MGAPGPLGLNQPVSVCQWEGQGHGQPGVQGLGRGPHRSVGLKQNCPSLALCVAGGL